MNPLNATQTRIYLLRPASFAALILPLLLICACATSKPRAITWKPVPAEALNHPLTLPECLQLAQTADIRVAEWRARRAAARAAIDASNEIPNPRFQPSWEDIGLHPAGATLFSSTYLISFPIFYWLTKKPQVDAAEAEARAEASAMDGDLRALESDIGSAWYELAAAQNKANVQRQLQHEASDALTEAQAKRQLGLISQHELLQSEAEAMQATADVESATSAARASGLTMAFALGTASPVVVQAAESDGLTTWTLSQSAASPAPQLSSDSFDALPPDWLIDAALKIDPAVPKARASREAAEAKLALQKVNQIPLADTGASGGMKHEPEGWGKVFSLDIPIPIFNWNRGAVKQAQADLLAAQAAEEKAHREVTARVSTDWQSWLAASHYDQSYSHPLDVARRRLADEAHELFQAGQISYIELLQARRDRDQAALAAVEQWQALMIAHWKLRVDIGQEGFPAVTMANIIDASADPGAAKGGR